MSTPEVEKIKKFCNEECEKLRDYYCNDAWVRSKAFESVINFIEQEGL